MNRYAAAVVLIPLFVVFACGDSPSAPSEQIPQVAGTYSGPLTLTSSAISGNLTGSASLTVVQSGS